MSLSFTIESYLVFILFYIVFVYSKLSGCVLGCKQQAYSREKKERKKKPHAREVEYFFYVFFLLVEFVFRKNRKNLLISSEKYSKRLCELDLLNHWLSIGDFFNDRWLWIIRKNCDFVGSKYGVVYGLKKIMFIYKINFDSKMAARFSEQHETTYET